MASPTGSPVAGLTGLEAGDHADDAIEQGSHGSEG